MAEKNLLETSLKQLDQLFSIVESTDDAIMICDANRQIQYINPAFIKLTGYQLVDMQESEMDLLRNGRYGQEYFDRRLFDGILKKLKKGSIFRGVLKAKRKNGKIYDAEMTITPVFNSDGKLMAYNVIERDVTLQEKYKEKVFEKLKHDSLTGLLNREALFDLVQNNLLLEEEITKRIRLRQGLSFLYLDIDHFRQINQELGYEVGDRVLIEFAKRIKSTLIEEDVIARVGGNEFVIILTRVNTVEGAEKIKQDLINQLKISFRVDDHILNIKYSIGLSLYPVDGLDFEGLINIAQDNMIANRPPALIKKVG
jgi:diguanylate cyclase (GGDEF)-like protein/PAS domain S-box-containing protein